MKGSRSPLRPFKKGKGLNTQRICDLLNGSEGYIALTSLDRPDIGPVNTTLVRELLLGPSLALPQATHAARKRKVQFAFPRHLSGGMRL